MKPLKSNRKQKAREQFHISQGVSKAHKLPKKPLFGGHISEIVSMVEEFLCWGDELDIIEMRLGLLYSNGSEVFTDAMKIISSPLSEALREGKEDYRINLYEIFNGSLTFRKTYP